MACDVIDLELGRSEEDLMSADRIGGRKNPSPKSLTRSEAREALPEGLRGTFDRLCDDTLAWSQYYYGKTLISYSIIKELVEDGWTKREAGK